MTCLRMNIFLSKTNKIEASIGIFICPCCSNYSTNSDTEFVQHMDHHHSNMKTIQCIYCNKIVNKLFIIQHTRFHYRSVVKSILKCRACDEFISIGCLENIFDHIKNCPSGFNGCINCDANFESDGYLIIHTKHNYSRLYHCNISNCKVKTDSYAELLDHMKYKGHFDFNSENIMLCNPMKLDVISDTIVNENCIQNNKKYIKLDLRPCNTEQQTPEVIREIIIPQKAQKLKKVDLHRREVEDIYELIFLQDDFRRNNFSQCNDFGLLNKLSSVSKYKIGKPNKKNEKIYYCMSCHYASCHSFNDVKKHILSQHCLIHHTDIPANMTFIMHKFLHKLSTCNPSSSKSAAPTTSAIPFEHIADSSDSKNTTSLTVKHDDNVTTYHSMNIPYSQRAFDIVYANKTGMVKQELLNKLHLLENCQINVNTSVRPKVFSCGHCKFESDHSVVDVKRHIMRKHCDLPSNLVLDFCKLTKLDKDWKILSDETIIDLFDERNCSINQCDSKNNQRMENRTIQQITDDREIVALQNIRDRKRKSIFHS